MRPQASISNPSMGARGPLRWQPRQQHVEDPLPKRYQLFEKNQVPLVGLQ